MDFSQILRYLPLIMRLAPEAPQLIAATSPLLQAIAKAAPDVDKAIHACAPVFVALQKAEADLLPVLKRIEAAIAASK